MFAPDAQKQNFTQKVISFPQENIVEISSSNDLVNFIDQAKKDFENNNYNNLYFLAYLISDKCRLQYKKEKSSNKEESSNNTINIGIDSISNNLKQMIEMEVNNDNSEFSKALMGLKNKINSNNFNYIHNGQILSPYSYFQLVYNRKIEPAKPSYSVEAKKTSNLDLEGITPKKTIDIQEMSTEDFSVYVQSLFFNVTNNNLANKDISVLKIDSPNSPINSIVLQLKNYFEPDENDKNVVHPQNEEKNMLEKAFLFFYFYFKRGMIDDNLASNFTLFLASNFTLSNTKEKTNFQKIIDFFKSESLDKNSDKVRSVSNIFSNSYLSSYFNSLIDNIIEIKKKK